MLLVHRAVRFFIFLLFFTAFVVLGHRAKADTGVGLEGQACVGASCEGSGFQRGMHLRVDSVAGPVLIFEVPGQEAADPQEKLVISEDLEARVQSSELSPEQAEMILTELKLFDGAFYGFPALEQLKMTLGFPSDAEFMAQDLEELIRVHLQVMLGTSPLTATYLVESLALREAIFGEKTEKPEVAATAEPLSY